MEGTKRKEKETKRIAKGTRRKEGPGGLPRGTGEKRDQEDCQGDQEKEGLGGLPRGPGEKRGQEDCQGDQRGTRRMEGARR